jgi:hypothetical protein
MHEKFNAVPVRKVLAACLAAAALAASTVVARPAEAAVATCSKDNRGNVCREVEICSGIGGNKLCETFYYWFPK